MLEKRQGFTLIEMLGAILILGLLFLLVIPSIISQIIKTTDDIDEATKKMIFSSSEAYIAKNNNDYPKTKGDVYCIPIQTLINSKELIEELVDSKTGKKINPLKMIKVTIENEANITYKIVNECDEIINDPSGANSPKLLQGMIPIKWDDDNEIIETTKYDSDWYNYGAKKWANAITKDGEDIATFWVWIPRYAYKITDGFHQTALNPEIDIKFLSGTTNNSKDGTKIETDDYNGSTKNTSMHYFLHPAFIFGEDENDNPNQIEGFWVAKFEPSGEENNIKILPNVESLRNMSIGEQFTAAQNMKSNSIYGWDENEVDTHMAKNTEWGAIAYLSQSKYGNPQEIWNNAFKNDDNYQTGCAGSKVDATDETSCVEWNKGNGPRASTTGNVYGVYDMKGGAWEYVAAYVNNGNNSLNNGNNILSASNKYKDVYNKATSDSAHDNYLATINKYGDAIWETSTDGSNKAWYGAASNFINCGSPWLTRGGGADGSGPGVFYFGCSAGNADYNLSFRPVALYSAVNE